jgi:hypothetical protein
MFIKKIWENKQDDSVHKQFVRFSKGTYAQRAVINARKTPQSLKISSTFELANDFVDFVSSLAASLKVSGLVLSKEKLELENERKKSGIYEYEIEKTINSQELKKILEKCYFCLVDCEAQGILLKIKRRLPRPGKGPDAKVNDKFCSLELANQYETQFNKEFLFDIPTYKKVKIGHTYEITEIVMPKELAKEKNFEKLRILAKRKGKIIRKTIVDGKENVKEKEFEA